MITLLDSVGSAIWRASWQAALLALVVGLILRGLGDRLAPRWRFLLWGVVLTRLLCVATPGAPWSAFNLMRWANESKSPTLARSEAELSAFDEPSQLRQAESAGSPEAQVSRGAGGGAAPTLEPATASVGSSTTLSDPTPNGSSFFSRQLTFGTLGRTLTCLWLAGCLCLTLKLLATAILLRRRLSSCRPLKDERILDLLESSCLRLDIGRTPRLLVTPECLSPCVVGTWKPQIVLPEWLVTEAPAGRLRHVLTHELAHLARRDLWTNWLLLAARTLHWFNPLAWWTVREMQAEREAACDELAFAVLGEVDRSSYAATLVDLAASLSPSALAPGLIGLFSKAGRLNARIERLLRDPSVSKLRAPVAASLLVGIALLGLTDAMSGATAQTPVSTQPADGCVVTGTVIDSVTGKPFAGAAITARRMDEWKETQATTDASGRFRIEVPEGRYDFLVEAKDRVCVAVRDRECLPGKPVEVPPFKLIEGGFISGRVINTATKEPIATTNDGNPIGLDLFGPSRPAGPVISPKKVATVDKDGRFKLRAAPGENFPFFVNIQGQRMGWDTQRQPPVIVKAGETTSYDMLVTPPLTPNEKMTAANKVVDALPKKPKERVAQIIVEFRKLNHTVNETELWCLLMRDLVAIGRDAVPQLCEELDRTTENCMMRRLGFALRAIGDTRATPALIRAVPKSLVPACSDYGLIVDDPALTEFMQANGLDKRRAGTHFSFGRPVREIVGALHALTGLDFEDIELFNMHLSENPRQQVLQRRIYIREAQRWQLWWEANWRTLTDDAAYQKVNLKIGNEELPPAPPPMTVSKSARIGMRMQGAVLSPASEKGQYIWHFYDLDTGLHPKWPAKIPKDETAPDSKALNEWAAQNGVDLMCITHRAPDGTETFVLKAFGMTIREISARDLRNLERTMAEGKLPEGQPVSELLMHYDSETKKPIPDANGIFLFTTREGSLGIIEITDRVTKVTDLTGQMGFTPGVGFHKGVRFNLSTIIP